MIIPCQLYSSSTFLLFDFFLFILKFVCVAFLYSFVSFPYTSSSSLIDPSQKLKVVLLYSGFMAPIFFPIDLLVNGVLDNLFRLVNLLLPPAAVRLQLVLGLLGCWGLENFFSRNLWVFGQDINECVLGLQDQLQRDLQSDNELLNDDFFLLGIGFFGGEQKKLGDSFLDCLSLINRWITWSRLKHLLMGCSFRGLDSVMMLQIKLGFGTVQQIQERSQTKSQTWDQPNIYIMALMQSIIQYFSNLLFYDLLAPKASSFVLSKIKLYYFSVDGQQPRY